MPNQDNEFMTWAKFIPVSVLVVASIIGANWLLIQSSESRLEKFVVSAEHRIEKIVEKLDSNTETMRDDIKMIQIQIATIQERLRRLENGNKSNERDY